MIPELEEGDFEIDEKARAATLTDEGAERVEAVLARHELLKSPNLYDSENVSVVHHLNQAVRAHKMFERDTDYIVKDGRVVIIDEFTGRMMPGRRFLRRAAPGAGGQGARAGSSRRTRRWPRSPSRTTSACTRSSPA